MARTKNKKPGNRQRGRVTKPSKPPKPKAKKTSTNTNTPKAHLPFHADDRILLVGEGDFSFARALIETHRCHNVVATCYDAEEELFQKYDPQAKENVEYLKDVGALVFTGVDATKLDHDKNLKGLRAAGSQGFQVIIFNFPHVGGISTDVNRQVRSNQELIVKFFTSATPLLAEHGTIVITLFDGEPYTLWNIKDLARHTGLQTQRSFKFMADAYPGYSHARTLGNIEGGGGWKGEDREARSYVFERKVEEAGSKVVVVHRAHVNQKKRAAKDESSGDED